MKSGGTIIFFVYLLFGVYFVNLALGFVALPEFLTNLNKWITLLGGALILLGGFNFLRARREKDMLKRERSRF
jgi:cytochrome c biogenesis protein CcdA